MKSIIDTKFPATIYAINQKNMVKSTYPKEDWFISENIGLAKERTKLYMVQFKHAVNDTKEYISEVKVLCDSNPNKEENDQMMNAISQMIINNHDTITEHKDNCITGVIRDSLEPIIKWLKMLGICFIIL